MYRLLTILMPFFALCVIVVGAFVRLSDAGLGCPDWPGCYGYLAVPSSAGDIESANLAFQHRPLESGKAWREMIHRYLAATLGLGIVVLAMLATFKPQPRDSRNLLYLLVALVIFQGLLGMWTVTLLLKPLIVVAHLLGGLVTLALLWWHYLGQRFPSNAVKRPAQRFIHIVLAIVVMQIFLGGWTSTNYAALACTDFPSCHGSFWPSMDFREGFTIWRGLGTNYEYGVLDTPARTAIHFSHRIGAVVTAISVICLAIWALGRSVAPMRKAAWCIIAALCVQIALGITNVLKGLPLSVAVAHNGAAAVLLLSIVTLKYFDNYNYKAD